MLVCRCGGNGSSGCPWFDLHGLSLVVIAKDIGDYFRDLCLPENLGPGRHTFREYTFVDGFHDHQRSAAMHPFGVAKIWPNEPAEVRTMAGGARRIEGDLPSFDD